MIVFYSEEISDNIGHLSGEDAKHCYKVLRKKEGDFITVLNGKGSICKCLISSISKSTVHFQVKEKEEFAHNQNLPTIGISMLKNQSRLEWFLEKATEIGIASFYPMKCDRTLKGKFRIERAESIVTSAVKQSLRPWKPKVNSDSTFDEIVERTQIEQKFICHFHPDNEHLYDIIDSNKPSIILIGPEGDFTDRELENAKSHGWIQVNISNSRLRTETAGITACQIVALKARS